MTLNAWNGLPDPEAPKNLREGEPYNDPKFEELARTYGIWGTAQSALCAQFWQAARRAPAVPVPQEWRELAQRCLTSMEDAVHFRKTGEGRPPEQTCLFEIEDLRAMLAAAPKKPESAENPLQEQLDEALQSLDFYKRRCNLLQSIQARMRDPERTMVCDVLANGHLLQGGDGRPDKARYSQPEAAPVRAVQHECLDCEDSGVNTKNGYDCAYCFGEMKAAEPKAPEVERRVCNSDECGWIGPIDEAVHQKRDAPDLLCPKCHESTGLAMSAMAAAPVPQVTDEMIEAAEEAYMPFGDMHLAIQAALDAAPQQPEAAFKQQLTVEAAPVQLPEYGIDTANHAGIRVRGYTEHQVLAILSKHGIKTK